MKNILIIGGTSGIGYGIAKVLLDEYNIEKLYIVGRNDKYEIGKNKKVVFIKSDLSKNDLSFLKNIKNIDSLFITAGIGKLDYFEKNSLEYIDEIINVNLKSPIKIIKNFYKKLSSSENDFYCCIITSICGYVSSPLFSLYSSTKAGIRYFIESLNVELQDTNSINKILNVSPGKINGTSFDGGDTNFLEIKKLCRTIIKKTLKKEDLYIPNKKIYKNVIKRYNKDFIKFGKESIKYKKIKMNNNE